MKDFYRHLAFSIAGSLHRAERLYRHMLTARLDAGGFVSQGSFVPLDPTAREQPPVSERTSRTRAQTMADLRYLRREASTALALAIRSEQRNTASRSRGDEKRESAADWLGVLLLIWLGQYFNGTPRPEVWQMIADNLDRFGGEPTLAFVMKAYGDVYRIERRRWIEHERLGRAGLPIGTWPDARGIITVVRHSVFIERDAPLRVEDIRVIEVRRKVFAEDRVYWAPHVDRELARNPEDDWCRMLATCLTERMARLYCATQALSYSRSGLPLQVVWREPAPEPSAETHEWRELTLPQDARQCLVAAPSGHEHKEPLRNLCVLNSREGVVRDLNESLANPAGRLLFSQRHTKLYDALHDYVTDREAEDFLVPYRVHPRPPRSS